MNRAALANPTAMVFQRRTIECLVVFIRKPKRRRLVVIGPEHAFCIISVVTSLEFWFYQSAPLLDLDDPWLPRWRGGVDYLPPARPPSPSCPALPAPAIDSTSNATGPEALTTSSTLWGRSKLPSGLTRRERRSYAEAAAAKRSAPHTLTHCCRVQPPPKRIGWRVRG